MVGEVQIKNKNIYLTVTAGRTGTGYLQKIFNIIPNFTSVHEPSIPTEGFWKNRLVDISKIKTEHYIETSHLICKGYIEPLLNCDIIPNLILLKRSPRKIALSLLSLNTIPNRTNLDKTYLLTAPKIYESLNDYQLCY